MFLSMDSKHLPVNFDKEYPFEKNYLTLSDGHRYHYLDSGSGEVVLMLHGNPTWSYYYRNVIKHLEYQGYRCIVPDHMGCGFSDKPQNYPYILKRHIHNAQSLLDHLGIKKYHLIVHDWGGAIGMGLATQNPENIGKITVLNTAAFLSQNIPFRISVCKFPILGEWITRALNGFAWPATWMTVENPLSKEVKQSYLLPYNSCKNRVAIWRFVKDIPLRKSDISYNTLVTIDESLKNLREKKMKIFWGGKDFCFNDLFYEEWVKRFPEAEKEYYQDSGHYILEDQKGNIEEKILTFLNS